MLTPSVVADVEVLRWPGESGRREACAERGIPCLLLLEDGVAPPATSPLEDWLRVPADELDLVARVRRLAALAGRRAEQPVVDEEGVLHVGRQWTALSTAEACLARRLAAEFGHLVGREELLEALSPMSSSPVASNQAGDPGAGNSPVPRRPRTLDLQICRLRRRITALGLTVSAVRSRGYVLENARPPREPSGPRPS